ncbi:hypothetical protein LV779_23255 [Streptomyces thinghirensis]|nr:hypothetical protein [Streptomyces thinghirensis]
MPAAYRLLIVETAHDCDREEVSPPLIAAMLKVESDFDPALADPAKNEYGIARWTPSVLRWWMNEDGTPGEEVPNHPSHPGVHPGDGPLPVLDHPAPRRRPRGRPPGADRRGLPGRRTTR